MSTPQPQGAPPRLTPLQQQVQHLQRLPRATTAEKRLFDDAAFSFTASPTPMYDHDTTAPGTKAVTAVGTLFGTPAWALAKTAGGMWVTPGGPQAPQGEAVGALQTDHITVMHMDAFLRSIQCRSSDCVSPNDYASRITDALLQQFDLAAELSTAAATGKPRMEASRSKVIRRLLEQRSRTDVADVSPEELAALRRDLRQTKLDLEAERRAAANALRPHHFEGAHRRLTTTRNEFHEVRTDVRLALRDMRDWIDLQAVDFKALAERCTQREQEEYQQQLALTQAEVGSLSEGDASSVGSPRSDAALALRHAVKHIADVVAVAASTAAVEIPFGKQADVVVRRAALGHYDEAHWAKIRAASARDPLLQSALHSAAWACEASSKLTVTQQRVTHLQGELMTARQRADTAEAQLRAAAKERSEAQAQASKPAPKPGGKRGRHGATSGRSPSRHGRGPSGGRPEMADKAVGTDGRGALAALRTLARRRPEILELPVAEVLGLRRDPRLMDSSRASTPATTGASTSAAVGSGAAATASTVDAQGRPVSGGGAAVGAGTGGGGGGGGEAESPHPSRPMTAGSTGTAAPDDGVQPLSQGAGDESGTAGREGPTPEHSDAAGTEAGAPGALRTDGEEGTNDGVAAVDSSSTQGGTAGEGHDGGGQDGAGGAGAAGAVPRTAPAAGGGATGRDGRRGAGRDGSPRSGSPDGRRMGSPRRRVFGPATFPPPPPRRDVAHGEDTGNLDQLRAQLGTMISASTAVTPQLFAVDGLPPSAPAGDAPLAKLGDAVSFTATAFTPSMAHRRVRNVTSPR